MRMFQAVPYRQVAMSAFGKRANVRHPADAVRIFAKTRELNSSFVVLKSLGSVQYCCTRARRVAVFGEIPKLNPNFRGAHPLGNMRFKWPSGEGCPGFC
jgi:hypothetical protein